jgi:TfoX/Sxy family transcriptional regulator of competence genes
MPYDRGLAQRLDAILDRRPRFQRKAMFGGIGWMLNGNMCVGVYQDWLITRIGEAAARDIFQEAHVKPMDITGKPMKGWAMIAPDGIADDDDLRRHIALAVDFVNSLPPKP